MPSCPISAERINEKQARIAGAITCMAALSYMAAPSPLWLLFLLLDFFARAFSRRFSLIARLSGIFARFLGKAQVVDAAPKKFAAKIGIAMSLGALLLHMAGLVEGAKALIAVMALCAFLEAAFSYCVGCKLYTLLRKFEKGFGKTA
ncbi:DUF4395 domain-containing protein [Hydrogenimonas cancrithermarum]|uniref:DUF4395 domain-containing protein n=1 Tax=Hydrogenimonas cancrithermarum TaxID=2993563 RepID=A0ABN6WWD5_9BACT|nr:DUF4395 domain-containing protein [Hydrogenimonas cancrithermarum]BDY13376.1 hypothetical protein HCR_16880 [Hydrogenimonas cancrithermarum]